MDMQANGRKTGSHVRVVYTNASAESLLVQTTHLDDAPLV